MRNFGFENRVHEPTRKPSWNYSGSRGFWLVYEDLSIVFFERSKGVLEKHECYLVGVWNFFFCIKNIISSAPFSPPSPTPT